MENDKIKYAENQQLMNIRIAISKNYDAILNDLERFKEELFIKDLRFSQLKDDMCLIRAENDEKNGIIQLLQEKYSEFPNELVNVNSSDSGNDSTFDDYQNSELFEGKLLIAEQINQLSGSCKADAENYRLADLINSLIMIIFDKEMQLETINTNLMDSIKEQNQQLIKEIDDHKEWQKHLEYENEKLNSEIEHYKCKQNILIGKDNEHNDLKEEYLKIQCMCDELSRENAYLKISVDEYQKRFAEKEMKCDDSDNLIKILKSNLREQVDKTEQANSVYYNEKEKCQQIESYIQQMIEEFTDRIHEKDMNIQSIQDDCCTLQKYISSADAEMENLKQNIFSLEYVIGEKNKTIQDMVKYKNKKQLLTTSTSQFNEMTQILNNLKQEMEIIKGDLWTYKNKVVNYENLIYNMQNAIQQHLKIKNYLKLKQKNIERVDRIKYQEFSKNLMNGKEIISLEHKKEIDTFKREIENLKKEQNMKITYLVDSEVKLKDEIQYLTEQLKLKSCQIIMAEKIAHSQMKEANNIIQHLIENSITKSPEFNEVIKNSEIHHQDVISTGKTDSKFQQIECLIDLMQKLKLEKNALKKICQIREDKIKYLENKHCLVQQLQLSFNNNY